MAEPAYRLDSLPVTGPAPAQTPDVRAVRTGTGEGRAEVSLAQTALKLGAALIVVVAVLAFARIALTSATVTTLIESDSLSSQIATARSAGVSLEMEQSVLSNPSAIRVAAKKLGMAAPYETEVIELSPDVVAIDGAGDLSLSGTVKNLVEIQG